MNDRAELVEKRLQRIEDERAILQNIYTYCVAFDQRRQEDWLDCFTKDAILAYEPSATVAETRGRIRLEGHKQISELFATSEQVVRLTSPKHVTVNAIVRVTGDEASAESIIVLFGDAGGIPELISTGRYLDKLRRCSDGRWRFCERIGHVDTLKAPPKAS